MGYIYSESINHPKTIEQLRAALGPDEYIYKRGFDQEKFTMDLLRMADMYQVKDLKADCSEYLKRNITDENMIDVWLGAEALEDENLSSTAIEHLAERPRGTPYKDLPGFSEDFQSSAHKPLRKLVDILSDKNHRLKDEILNLKEKVTKLESSGTIKIEVKRRGEWTEFVDIKPTETISTLIQEVNNRRPGGWNTLTKNTHTKKFEYLNSNATFLQETISTDITLYIWKL